MRLSAYYQRVIKQKAAEVFGTNVRVYLFGSRIDDSKKGGDIDLWIETTDQRDLIRKKVRFLAALDRKLGEQKMDVLFFRNGSTGIERTALETGIRLWAYILKKSTVFLRNVKDIFTEWILLTLKLPTWCP